VTWPDWLARLWRHGSWAGKWRKSLSSDHSLSSRTQPQGKLGGFSSFGGPETKVQLLEIESDGQAGKSERYERIRVGRR